MTAPLPQHVAAGERLLLRPLRDSDAPAYRRWLDNPGIARTYVASSERFGPTDIAEALVWAAEIDGVDAWAIDDRAGNFVGAAFSRPDFPFTSVREAEVTLSPELPKRRGYGLEAHRLVVDHIFSAQPGVRKLIGRVASYNHAEIRIMQRLGAKQEGCLREHLEIGDEVHDLLIFGRLRHERNSDEPHNPSGVR